LAESAWVRDVPGGSVLRVHVRPGAARSGVAGLYGGALALRVRAQPRDGAANRELLAVLAEALGCRPHAVTIEGAAHRRDKRIRLRGLGADAVRERLGAGLARGPRIDKDGGGR
jgi:hypothetical protein